MGQHENKPSVKKKLNKMKSKASKAGTVKTLNEIEYNDYNKDIEYNKDDRNDNKEVYYTMVETV